MRGFSRFLSRRVSRLGPLASVLPVLALVALVALSARPAAAQELRLPRAEQGYYYGFGGHGLLLAPVENQLDLKAMGGLGITLRAGEKITDQLSIGFLLDISYAFMERWSGVGGAMLVEGRYQPSLRVPVNLRAALGAGGWSFRGKMREGEDAVEPDGGLTVRFGISYAIFIDHDPNRYQSGGFGVAPFLEVQAVIGSDSLLPSVILGLDFQWWTGLEKRYLDLPFSELSPKEEG